jgi:hypothetical protein
MTHSGKSGASPKEGCGAQTGAPDKERVKTLLDLGVNAIKGASKGVLARQVRIFDALFQPNAERADGSSHNFEAVFDERVARSLARLGYPPPEVMNALVQVLLAATGTPAESDVKIAQAEAKPAPRSTRPKPVAKVKRAPAKAKAAPAAAGKARSGGAKKSPE